MKKRRILFNTLFVLLLAGAASLGTYGQSEARSVEPSYEVSLQLIVGSNDAASRPELPANLGNILKHFKSTFAFSNYRLASTVLGRIANNGTFEFKSIHNFFGQESERDRPTFMEWSLSNFHNGLTVKGRQGFQIETLRFGARVPIIVSSTTEGATRSVVNYEQIGLSLRKVGLVENSPALIGTLNLPGIEGTVFLVMTVRSVDL
jgi:hypothetical protein